MKHALALTACLALAGCAGTALDDAPEAAWTSARSLDDTVSCVVAALNIGNASYSVPWSARIISPGKVYDVRPERQLVAGHDPVILRATALDTGGTRLQLHSTGLLGRNLVTPHVGQCAEMVRPLGS